MGERVPGLMVWAWAMAATTSPAGSSAGSVPFCTGRVTCRPVAIGSDMAAAFAVASGQVAEDEEDWYRKLASRCLVAPGAMPGSVGVARIAARAQARRGGPN